MEFINKNILLVEDKHYFFSKSNAIYKTSFETHQTEKIGNFPASILDKIFLHNKLFKRISRRDVHHLNRLPNGALIGIIQKGIILQKRGQTTFQKVFHIPRGSRPLNLAIHPTNGRVFFGEYFQNKNRETVHVYGSENGLDWKIYYTFPANSIRHIHRIIYDEFRKGWWVLTGDTDEESGLWFSKDNFKTLELITGGSQKARAVSIIPTKDGLIIPMDSPEEKNYIHFFDTNKKEFKTLRALIGPAFHASYQALTKRYFITTVVEPKLFSKTTKTAIYTSKDGLDWECLDSFEQDRLSKLSYHYFRYPEIIIFPNNHRSKSFFYCRGIQKYNGKTITYSLD